jgi:hypothetical protein
VEPPVLRASAAANAIVVPQETTTAPNDEKEDGEGKEADQKDP